MPKSRQDTFAIIAALTKQVEILKRRLDQQNKRVFFSHLDRKFFAFITQLSDKVMDKIKIVKPETILKWSRQYIAKLWTFPRKHAPVGRPRTPKEIREMVLKIKNENNWGLGKISGELLKLGIKLSETTISRILDDYRRKGKVRKSLTWSKFIKSHLKSLYATDIFTLDTIFGIRYYVLFIIHLKTRKIITYNVTRNPTREFVRQQLIELTDRIDNEPVYLIHDGSGEYVYIDYSQYNIKNIRISPKAPNMNAYAERFIGSIRREAFDWFVLFNEKQIRNILKEYVNYYNSLRPHQGIDQNIPAGYEPNTNGDIVSKPVLSGLINHYYRKAA